MAYILSKIETVTDINYYEVELTEEQAALYKENEEKFWDKFGNEVEGNMTLVNDEVGDPDNEYELIEE